jgi:hypothetical protein
MANSPAVVIDLSSARWPGEEGPAGGSTLSDAELADLEQVMAEVDAEFGGTDNGKLSDAELADLLAAAEADAGPEPATADAFTEFDRAFSARISADAARQDAISAAIVEDTMHPARRDEDRMARIVARAADGVYSGLAMSNGGYEAAVELAVATGKGTCGTPDEFGRCSSRYHELDCQHSTGTDWQASGPPRTGYETALANLGAAAAATPAGPVWGDDDAQYPVPPRTLELAHELDTDWGLADGDPFAAPSHADLLRAPGAPVTVRDSLLSGMGYEVPRQQMPSYPGVSELARELGLR